MKATNARKALSRVGTLKTGPNGSGRVVIGEHEVEFLVNGKDHPEAEVATVRVRRLSDRDEPESDYCAGSFFDTIGGAIKWATKEAAYDAEQRAKHDASHNPADLSDVTMGCMFCIRARQGRHLSLVNP